MNEHPASNGYESRKYWPFPLAVAFSIADEPRRRAAMEGATEILREYPLIPSFRPHIASCVRMVVVSALAERNSSDDGERREGEGVVEYRRGERALMDAIENDEVATLGRSAASDPVRPIPSHEWVNGMLYYGATADLGPISDIDPDDLLSVALNPAPEPWYRDVVVDRDSLFRWLGREQHSRPRAVAPRLGRPSIDDSALVQRACDLAGKKGLNASDAALAAIEELHSGELSRLPGKGSDDSKLARVVTKVKAALGECS